MILASNMPLTLLTIHNECSDLAFVRIPGIANQLGRQDRVGAVFVTQDGPDVLPSEHTPLHGHVTAGPKKDHQAVVHSLERRIKGPGMLAQDVVHVVHNPHRIVDSLPHSPMVELHERLVHRRHFRIS
jgi:hypothetical protein